MNRRTASNHKGCAPTVTPVEIHLRFAGNSKGQYFLPHTGQPQGPPTATQTTPCPYGTIAIYHTQGNLKGPPPPPRPPLAPTERLRSVLKKCIDRKGCPYH